MPCTAVSVDIQLSKNKKTEVGGGRAWRLGIGEKGGPTNDRGTGSEILDDLLGRGSELFPPVIMKNVSRTC